MSSFTTFRLSELSGLQLYHIVIEKHDHCEKRSLQFGAYRLFQNTLFKRLGGVHHREAGPLLLRSMVTSKAFMTEVDLRRSASKENMYLEIYVAIYKFRWSSKLWGIDALFMNRCRLTEPQNSISRPPMDYPGSYSPKKSKSNITLNGLERTVWYDISEPSW